MRPGIGWALALAELPSIRRRLRRRVHQASPHLLRVPGLGSWLRRRAVAAWLAAERPAFVCHGNVCRSPFAAALARRQLPHLAVVDAGTHADEAASPPELAVEVARTYDVDLTLHRPRRWDASDAPVADAVFVFDLRTWWYVLRSHPGVARRVHLLGSLADESSPIIDDPYGGEREAYVSTYSRISTILEGAVEARRNTV